MLRHTLAAAITASALCAAAHGQSTLFGAVAVDNLFVASISTSATTAGTNWFSGNSWPTTFSSSFDITDAGTYFLHVFAQDQGRPEMFIGRFTLSGGGFFANNSQELLTNATDWVVSNDGFGINTTAPTVLGPNGMGPWGNYAAMQNASFIWAPQYANGVAYFTASFTVIPTPASAAAGLLGLTALRRKR